MGKERYFNYPLVIIFKENGYKHVKVSFLIMFKSEPAAKHGPDRNRPSTPASIIPDGSATQDGHLFIQKIIQTLMTPCPPRFSDSSPE